MDRNVCHSIMYDEMMTKTIIPDEVKDILRQDITEPAKSVFTVSVVLVQEKDRCHRLRGLHGIKLRYSTIS